MNRGTVENINGRPTLVVDGEVIPPMSVCCRAYGEDNYIKGLAVDSAVRLFFVEVDSGFNDPSAYDRMKREIGTILKHRPDALFFLRLWVNPSNEWLLANPDECVAFDAPGNIDVYPKPVRAVHGVTVHRIHSIASRKWLDDLRPYLQSLMKRVDEESFSDSIIGYFPCALHGEEWFVPREDILEKGWDWSPAFKNFYSHWLEKKYGTDSVLRSAWGRENVTLADPWIVPVAERKLFDIAEEAAVVRPGSRAGIQGDFGSFLDPAVSCAEIDLYHAFMAATIESIRGICGMVKDASDGALVGTFYSGFGTQEYTLGGTVAPYTMLSESPEVDILAAPFNYVDRCSGGGASFHRIPTKSLHLHGKLWFTEAESPSWKTTPELAQYYHGDKHSDEFAVLNILKRDFASILAANVQGWWFNNAPKTHIPGAWTQRAEDQWCDDPKIFSLFAKCQKIAAKHYEREIANVAETAFVYDEKSNWCCDGETAIDLLWFSETFEYSRCGFPTDRIFHQDLANPTTPTYKLLVFVNCFSLTNSERQVISDYLRHSGAVALWLWGNGLINPDSTGRVDLDEMSALTGFDFSYEMKERPMAFTVSRDSHELVKDIHSRFRFGNFRRPVMSGGLAIGGRHVLGRTVPLDASLGNPLLTVTPIPDVTIMGRFLANDAGAFAITADGRSIYHGAKILNAPLLTRIAEFAGVHIWSKNDDVFYCDGGFFSIHASEASNDTPYHIDEALKDDDALKKIFLPHVSNVVDCYTDETVCENDDKFSISMKAGETKSYYCIANNMA